MQHVAADRDDDARQLALGAADRQRVEQRLRRMLVLAVAGIDDGAGNLLCEQRGGTGGRMADDQHIRPHRVQRHRRIDQRFALLHRGIADRHVHDVGAEPFSGEFEGGLRAGRGFEEQVDLRQAAQRRRLLLSLAADLDGLVGLVEQKVISCSVRPLMPIRWRWGKKTMNLPLAVSGGSIMSVAPRGKHVLWAKAHAPCILRQIR